MTNTAITALLSQGEGLTLEFKECKTSLGNSVFETVCSFSNRYGGYIFLGVNDKGAIQGVEPSFGLNLTHNSKRDYLSF
jgi:ATP-dependent DNA helicase RecG